MTTLFETTHSVMPSGAARVERLDADDAAGARLVLDHDRLPERFGERRLRGARDRVDAGAGGIRAGRCGRPSLRPERPAPRTVRHEAGRDAVATRGDECASANARKCRTSRFSNQLTVSFRPPRVAGRARRSRSRVEPERRQQRASVRAEPRRIEAARRGARPAIVNGSSVVLTVCPAFVAIGQADVSAGRRWR